jgi:hypothetical protein
MNKYEKLIEYIINEQDDKAKALFHQIVVEKSRSIYESLIDENDFDESMNADKDEVEDLVDEVSVDDEALPEAADDEDEDGMGDDVMDIDASDDDMDMDASDDDMGDEDMGDDDMDMGDDDMGDMGDEGDIEDRVMDLETALDDLKAEFDKLMADEANEPEHDDIMGDEMGADDEMDTDEPGMVREYTEKVSAGHGVEKKGSPEGHEVGQGKSAPVNKQSIVAGSNKMGGGSTANIVRGGAESAPDGQKPHGKAGGFVKPAQEIDVAKRNVNKPGGNNGAQQFYNKKETSYESSKGAEGQTTAGKMSVDSNSLVGSKKIR